MNYSLWEIVKMGGVAMWIIIACSVIAVAVALERAFGLWAFVRRARMLTDTVTRCVSSGAVAEARTACERSRSSLADVFLVGFERMGRASREALEGAVDRERQRVTSGLRTRLWVLGTIGAVAPFVGLFGTVVGIMNAFHTISTHQQLNIAIVGKPLAEALVATAGGLAVAIEAVVIYNFFNQHLGRVGQELRLFTEEFLETMREKGNEDGARQATGG